MLYWAVGVIIILIGVSYAFNTYMHQQKQPETPLVTNENSPATEGPVHVTPIMHATAVLNWGGTIIYTDPTDASLLSGQPAANIVLVTDIHFDHLSTSTLEAIVGPTTALIVPKAVADMLPADLAARAHVLANGATTTEQDLNIEAIPMYNIPESPKAFHTKGRGNGYVIEKDGYRVYVAGDTSGIPEMRALQNIAIAFIPMNLPYTMDVEEAADAVLAFKPKIVYPYHYRGQNGLSDVNHFKELVNAGDPNINVILLNWYPGQ